MANTTITRAQALQFAMKLIEDTSDAPEYMAAHEVLGNMLAQVTKPRKAAVSKARKMNENLVDKIYKLVADNHEVAVTTKDIVALGLPEIATTQKAAAVLRVACELGKFEKVVNGKKVGYKKVIAE